MSFVLHRVRIERLLLVFKTKIYSVVQKNGYPVLFLG